MILRLRHVVALGAGREVPDRRAGARAGRGGLQLGVPLPRPDRRRQHAGDRDHAVGRDGRHARRAARGEDSTARAASRSATSSAAWRRARPTARSTRTPARRSASPRPRRSRRSSWRCTCSRSALGQARGTLDARRGAAAPRGARRSCRVCIEQTLKLRRRDPRSSPSASPAPGLPLSRPRHQLSDRARGRAEAEGDLLHPRRGLSGRRDEARPDRAHRRRPAGGRARADDARVREDAGQHPGSEGARRRGDRGDQRVEGRARSSSCWIRRATSCSRCPTRIRCCCRCCWWCRCSCSRITSRSAAAATSISRGISPRA